MQDLLDNLYLILGTSLLFHIFVFVIDQMIKKKLPHNISKIKCEKLKTQEKWVYILSITSLIHALYAFVVGIVVMNHVGFRIGFEFENTAMELKYVSIVLGYFIFDSLMGFYTKHNNFVMNIHHLNSFLILTYVMAKKKYINQVVWTTIIAESSNILLQIWTIVKKHNLNPIFKNVLGISFLSAFFYTRIIVLGRFHFYFIETDCSLTNKFFGATMCKLKSLYRFVFLLFCF
jgi:hypothetical protein